MASVTQLQKNDSENILHYPNLKTVLMVEKVLEDADEPITREELKRRLPVKIMHQTLNVILDYFEDKGMIYDGRKGILWTYNPNPKFREILEKSIRVK